MAKYNDNRSGGASGTATKQKSEFYIKLGYWDTDSEDKKVFVSIPAVIYLDQLECKQVNGESDFADTVCKGNDLLNEIRDGAKAHLEPGDTHEIKNLTVVVCRKKTSAEVNHKKVTRGIWD